MTDFSKKSLTVPQNSAENGIGGLQQEKARNVVESQTKENLNPLAYATAYQATEGDLDRFSQEVAFQREHKKFQDIITQKVHQGFYEKSFQNLKDAPKKLMNQIVRDLGQDPDVDFQWKKLVSFDHANLKISAGLLAYDFLGRGPQDRVKALPRDANIAQKSLAYLKPILIANVILQPGVLGVAKTAAKGAGRVAVKTGEVAKNALYGLVSGDLFQEGKSLVKGQNGDPLEYLWNAKTSRQRTIEELKNPSTFQTPEKLKGYFNPELRSMYDAMGNYKNQPEKIRGKIPKMAEFVFRSAQTSLSEKELGRFFLDLNAKKFHAGEVRQVMMMSASGGVMQFFLETASDADRDEFLKQLNKIGARRFPPKKFGTTELQALMPRVNAKLSQKEKTGLRSVLGLGGTGIALGVMLTTWALTWVASSALGQGVFELLEPEGGRDRVVSRAVEGTKEIAKKVMYVPKRQWNELWTFVGKGKHKDGLKQLGGKDGILTEAEIDRITGSKVTDNQRKYIFKELEASFKDRENRKITADEFWDMKSIKKLRGKNLRDEIKK